MGDKINVIIVDDEKKDRENMRLLLESYCPQVSIMAEAFDKKSILSVLKKQHPDLVFMDIQLGTLSVFEVLNELEHISFEIVFVTAHDSYAIQSYDYEALDYVMKPVDPRRLIKIVDKLLRRKASSNTQQGLLQDFKTMYTKTLSPSQISITDSKGIHVIKTNELLYCIGDGNYTTFVMKDQSKIVISKNLKHFETNMSDYQFLRIHKSYLVNLNHIGFIVKEQGGYVLMKDGTSLPVSRSYKKALYKKMNVI